MDEFRYSVVASSLHDRPSVERITAPLRVRLDALGEASPDLCRTQVTAHVADDRPVGRLLDDPLGNHLVMVQGHHRDRLERWWHLAFGDQ